MKKIFLFIILCSIFTTIFAQTPIIDGSFLPVRGTAIKQVFDTVRGELPIPQEGADIYWDYSNAFVHTTDTSTLATFHPSETPYGQYFPNATHASYLEDVLGDTLYSFFRIDTAGMHGVGTFNKQQLFDTVFISTPNELVMPFEVQYGDTINDSSFTYAYFQYTIYFFGQPQIKTCMITHTKVKTLIGAGYGSLSTPIGTFHDVLLGKEIVHTVDSIFVDMNNTGSFSYLAPGQYFNYVPLHNYVWFHFLRNNTFATSHLMYMRADTALTTVDHGWYTLPVDIGSIEGTIYDTTGLPVIAGEVYLYRDSSNFKKNDILDKTIIESDGTYKFDSIPYGNYRIAARADSINYPNALTTYYGDTTNWVYAQTIVTTNDVSDKDITIQYAPALTGLGQISGNIIYNLSMSKSMSTGEPLKDIDVSIDQNPSGYLIKQASTDSSGNFNFSDLPDTPNGSVYQLTVEIPGLHMNSTYDFVIQNGAILSNMNYDVSLDSIYAISNIVTKTNENKSFDNIIIFPNPAKDKITSKLTISETTILKIKLTDVLGKSSILYNNQVNSGKYEYTFNLSDFDSGIYMMTILYENKEFTKKIVIQ